MGSPYGNAVNSERLEAATVEIEMVSDIFNRLVKSCHAKCIDTGYHDEQLSKGEGQCADRCGMFRSVIVTILHD